ncbi:VOC family protein [Lysinibacillus fusiformis]|uniref:Methylmalonyl-CoA epimerase n=1 Tax=Lysinibacillus fusiformis TaxID=28031 RepID=A0A1E4R689_9BACI|nr:VOC family protein [Lysinibacillus fusiformis]ODV55997.1 methylmalonyl-CoA epimerase [Lysinibacillus fusiformis]
MGNQVCVISIYVPDLNKAIDFYTNTLGFELNKQYGPNIASLVHGELPIILEAKDNITSNQDNKNTGVVLGLRTEDIYETVKFLKDKEVEFIVDEPTSCPPGKYISFRDPFGNILEYLQFENM